MQGAGAGGADASKDCLLLAILAVALKAFDNLQPVTICKHQLPQLGYLEGIMHALPHDIKGCLH